MGEPVLHKTKDAAFNAWLKKNFTQSFFKSAQVPVMRTYWETNIFPLYGLGDQPLMPKEAATAGTPDATVDKLLGTTAPAPTAAPSPTPTPTPRPATEEEEVDRLLGQKPTFESEQERKIALGMMRAYTDWQVEQGILPKEIAEANYKDAEYKLTKGESTINGVVFPTLASLPLYRETTQWYESAAATRRAETKAANAAAQADYERQLALYERGQAAELEAFKRSPIEALTASSEVEAQRIAQAREVQRRSMAADQQARGEAMSRALSGEPAPEPIGLPPIPDINPALRQYIESASSPNLQRFISSGIGDVIDEFEQQYPGARGAWWRAMNPPSPRDRTDEISRTADALKIWQSISKQAKEANEISAPAGTIQRQQFDVADQQVALLEKQLADITNEQVAANAATRTYDEGGRLASEGGVENPRLPKTEDPYLKAVKEYPWWQKFIVKPPSQRGFYSGNIAPRARWITG